MKAYIVLTVSLAISSAAFPAVEQLSERSFALKDGNHATDPHLFLNYSRFCAGNILNSDLKLGHLEDTFYREDLVIYTHAEFGSAGFSDPLLQT